MALYSFQGILQIFYYLREDGGRDGTRKLLQAKTRMKSRQHYILTITPSDNSTSPELVALLHMTVFHPSQNNFFFQGGRGGGSRTFFAMRTTYKLYFGYQTTDTHHKLQTQNNVQQFVHHMQETMHLWKDCV